MESTILKQTDAPRRLMLAFAHPDDESFGPAGTIVRYASQGVAVHYVCATRGEAGTVDPELLEGYSSLAELRTEELFCAARHLELAAVHLLDYHDSGMQNTPENQNPLCLFQAPLEEVAAKITRLIRQIQPQVVITFDPTGGYFHPDHVKMHQATSLAFHAAGDPGAFPHLLEPGLEPYQPAKLYHHTLPHRWVKLAVKILPLFGQDPSAMGRNKDIDLTLFVGDEAAITTRIRVAPYVEASQRAAACYASQGAHSGGRLMGYLRRWLFRYDTYSRAVPAYEGSGLEDDLFFGLDGLPGPARTRTASA